MSGLWANGLSAIIEGTSKKQTKADSLADLEAYADLLGDMSEISQTDAQIQRHVDRLDYEDDGFLLNYDAYSFCSTAQVQNSNINQIQGSKVVGQNSLQPVQLHEM